VGFKQWISSISQYYHCHF